MPGSVPILSDLKAGKEIQLVGKEVEQKETKRTKRN
jgi:hypothetical protein